MGAVYQMGIWVEFRSVRRAVAGACGLSAKVAHRSIRTPPRCCRCRILGGGALGEWKLSVAVGRPLAGKLCYGIRSDIDMAHDTKHHTDHHSLRDTVRVTDGYGCTYTVRHRTHSTHTL